LTPRGHQQVERLSAILETLLPEGIHGTLVSSPSRRTFQTAELFSPLIARKTGERIYIEPEELLSELRSMGSDESILVNGRENVVLVEKYHSSQYGFFVAHERIIAATCISIADAYSLAMPDPLRLIVDQPDEELVAWYMKRVDCSREQALEKIRSVDPHPLVDLPPIAEASAIHLDLVQKQVKYILP